MALQNFTSLDFDQIKATLRDYLKSNSNFTDYDFEGSNLSTILDVLAYNTYITSYNANMITNEIFIDTATLRENIVSLARNIGYVPRSRKAASASINFFVDTTDIFPAPSTITLQKGIVVATSTQFGNSSYVFSILEDITVPVIDNIALFSDIKVYEGNVIDQSFTYTSRQPNQKFVLNNSGIDSNLIQVLVRSSERSNISVKYNLQDSLFDINGDSKVYFLQEVEDERYELIFGDDIFGKKLEDGNYIQTSYLITSGSSANGIDKFSFSGRLVYIQNGEEYVVTSGISLVTTNLPAKGGEMIEGVESIRKYAPRIYSSHNRAVTTNDYETLIPTKIYPDTESISVFGGEDTIPPQYGKVFISIKPKTGEFLSNAIKENIRRDLKKYSVAGIVPEILDLKYLYIEVESQIYYNTNLAPNAATVSSIIQDNVSKYADSSELNKYGARFKYSKFLKIIDDSHNSVTSNITKLQMRRDLRVALNSFAEYRIGFGNQFHIKNPNGYNIKSTGFNIANLNTTVYLGDLPNSDQKTGSLFFFTVDTPTSPQPTILQKNIGTIDYINGIIILNPVNITSAPVKNSQPTIEISALPQSNDIIGLQDLYLQLDISMSKFEMLPDRISSGADPSGTTYITSSSYKNGILVRA